MGNGLNIQKKRLLTREEEVALAQKIKVGDKEAYRHMFEANMGLVYSLAKRQQGCGLELDDLIQEGSIGLMRAIDKFDYNRGTKFSTCAYAWIFQALRRAVEDNASTIRIPAFMQAEILQMKKISASLGQELGREPRIREIANEMGLEQARIKELVQVANTQPSSINVIVGDDCDTELMDMIPCDSHVQMVSHTESRQFKDIIEELLTSWLTEEEETVLRLRFGIGSRKQYTLEGVSKKMGIPLEKVRQVEDQALRKLKPRAHAKQLEVFLR